MVSGVSIITNAGQVARELATFEPTINDCIATALRSKTLNEKARASAGRALVAIAESDAELKIVGRYVNTVLVSTVSESVVMWSMESGMEVRLNLGAFADAAKVGSLIMMGDTLSNKDLQEFLMRFWDERKEKTEVEQKMTKEQGAVRLAKVLFSPFLRRPTPLIGEMQAFANELAGEFGLSVERNNLWMMTVMETWVAEVLATLPGLIRTLIGTELKQSMMNL